ncbi:MAG: GntR family transcriptional regulator [Gemmataceae bacterium]
MPRSKPGAPKRTKRVPIPAAEVTTGAEGASLVEAVYHRLLYGILTGVYPDGSVLSELGVARDLGVSRTPVHDALRLLGKDGLVVRERNCRARVAAITPDDVFEVFEMRKILEGPAAELAAGRMDRRHLTPLRTAADWLAANPKAADWVTRWAEFDEAFHREIANASGNRRLAADINRYRLLHTGFNRLATDATTLKPALAEHIAILEALETRNGPLARERMVAHIATWQDHFIQHVPRPRPGGPG